MNFVGGYFGAKKVGTVGIQFQSGARPACALCDERSPGQGDELSLDQFGCNQRHRRPGQTEIASYFCSGEDPLFLQQPENARLVYMTEKG